MEKQDIINYVLTTPENTNPAVLKGMLEQLESEAGEGGGGGGESDFSTATATVTAVLTDNGGGMPAIADIQIPYIYDIEGFLQRIMGTYLLNNGENEITVVLYKGNAIVSSDYQITTLNGNIEYDEENGIYIITGDCSFTVTNTE